MEIRILNENEIPYAAALARHVFDVCLRNTINRPEMLEAFENYVAEENLTTLVKAGKLVLWGGFFEGNLCGVSGMQKEGHITLLYVLPACQRRGLGKDLLGTMRRYGSAVWQLKRVTVNAMPIWTGGFFQRNGFKVINMDNAAGRPFTPLEAKAIREVRYPVKPIKMGTLFGVILGFSGAAVLFTILFMIYMVNTI